jgi:hypothetical protein
MPDPLLSYPTVKRTAQVAYEAYMTVHKHVAPDGQLWDPWVTLSPVQQAAWEVVIQAVFDWVFPDNR